MSTKLAFNQIDGNVSNVKDFGAVNGATDSSAAFNSAFAAGNVVVADGAFTLSSDVTLPSGVDFISYEGATLTCAGNFIITGASLIENISWDMNGTSKQVYGENSPDVTVRNCSVTGSTNNGLYFYDGPTNLEITGCTTTLNDKIGIYVSGSVTNAPDDIRIFNNKSHTNGTQGIVVAGKGELTAGPQTANYATNVQIKHNTVYGNGTVSQSNGIGFPYCQYAQVSGNLSYNNTEHGISCQETTDFSVRGNTCYGNTEGGFSCQSGFDPYRETQRGLVCENILYTNKAGLFFKEQCKDIIVSGNMLLGNTTYAARLVDIGSSGLVSDNIMFTGNAIPISGTTVVNSNGSTNITTSPSYNSYGRPLQPNQAITEDLSTTITLDTKGAAQNYPEVFYLDNSGANVTRTLIAQAVKGRRIVLQADSDGGVVIEHNQGDDVTYSGFFLSSGANVTLSAYENITFIGNGIRWIETANNT